MSNPFWSPDSSSFDAVPSGDEGSQDSNPQFHQEELFSSRPVIQQRDRIYPVAHSMPAQPEMMVDPLFDRFDLAFLIRKNIGKLILVPLVCMALAGFYRFKQEPIYKSSALLLVDSGLNDLLQFEPVDDGSSPLEQSLRSMEVTIISDAVILRVIDKLGLRERPGFLPAGLAENGPVSDSKLLNYLRSHRIEAALQPETRLIKISVTDPDPERAREIAAAFVEEFEGFLADQRKQEAIFVRESLQGQLKEARDAALAAEAQLKDFREQNSSVPLEQDHDLFSTRLAQFGEELNQAVHLRVELESLDASLNEIDPDQNPIDVIEVADYQGKAHVASLLSALSTSRSRLAVAEERFTERNPAYLAAKAEVDRNFELLREQALDIKKTVKARYEAALSRESLVRSELDKLQQELVSVKSISSEFRALQSEAESSWLLHTALQQKMGEAVASTDLPGKIATVVSPPLTPHKKANTPTIFFLIAGGAVGVFLVGVWVIFKVLTGLPFSNSRQIEDRLGLPVIADWSNNRPDLSPTPSPGLMQTLSSSQSQVIQVSAPGLNQEGESVAERVARHASETGRETLLLVVKPEANQSGGPRTVAPGLDRLEVTPEVALDESAFRAGIASFRQKYEKVIVEAGAVTDPSAVDWISNFTDQDVVVVARGQMTKDEVASRVRRLSRPDSSPVALILVDPNRRRTWSRKQDDFGFSVPAHHTA